MNRGTAFTFEDLPRFFDSLCKAASAEDEDIGDEIRSETEDLVRIASEDVFLEYVKRPVVIVVEFKFPDKPSSAENTIRLAFSINLGRADWSERIEYSIGRKIEPNDGVFILTIPSLVLCNIITGDVDPCISFRRGRYEISPVSSLRFRAGIELLSPFWEILTYHYQRGFQQSIEAEDRER
nr:hypothetical protein [Candidatus Sigynarchaeum springense]